MKRAMRFFIGVHKFSPTCGVQGDTGWLSMKQTLHYNYKILEQTY